MCQNLDCGRPKARREPGPEASRDRTSARSPQPAPAAGRGARRRPALAALHEVDPASGPAPRARRRHQHPSATAADARRARRCRRHVNGLGTAGPTFRGGRPSTTPPTASTRPRSSATSTTARRPAPAERPGAARVDLIAADKEIEVAPGREVPGLDLQRPRSRARRCAAPRATGCGSGSSTAPSTRTPSTSTACIRPTMDGVPGAGRRDHRAGQVDGLRVRRRAVRAPPLPLPRRAAGRAHRPRHVRRRSSSTRRPGRPDADEMVMVQHGYNTTFDAEGNQFYAVNGIPFHYMTEPIQVAARRAGPDLPRQHARVRPDQLVPHPRELLQLLPDRHQPRADRVHRHDRPGPGRSGASARCASPTPGAFMFHAHKTEFAELGWMGFFEVGLMEARGDVDRPRRAARRRSDLGARRRRRGADRRRSSVALAVARRTTACRIALGPPVEELAVERTELAPNQIELTRSQHRPGRRPHRPGVRQRRLRRLHRAASARSAGSDRSTITLNYPWHEGQPYLDLARHLDRAS